MQSYNEFHQVFISKDGYNMQLWDFNENQSYNKAISDVNFVAMIYLNWYHLYIILNTFKDRL